MYLSWQNTHLPSTHETLGSTPTTTETRSTGACLECQHLGGRGRRVKSSSSSLATQRAQGYPGPRLSTNTHRVLGFGWCSLFIPVSAVACRRLWKTETVWELLLAFSWYACPTSREWFKYLFLRVRNPSSTLLPQEDGGPSASLRPWEVTLFYPLELHHHISFPWPVQVSNHLHLKSVALQWAGRPRGSRLHPSTWCLVHNLFISSALHSWSGLLLSVCSFSCIVYAVRTLNLNFQIAVLRKRKTICWQGSWPQNENGKVLFLPYPMTYS